MKYGININQKAIIDHGLEINLVEAVILDVCRDFSASGACECFVEGGKRYYWFKHEKICQELPILDIKPDSAYRKMKGLCDKKFLYAHPNNKRYNTSWYAFLPLADLLVGTYGKANQPSEENPMVKSRTIGRKSEGQPSENNPMVGSEPSEESPKVADEPSENNPMVDQKQAGPSEKNPATIGELSDRPSEKNPMYYNTSNQGTRDHSTSEKTKDDEDAERAGANAPTSSSLTLPAERPSTPPDSARPPASPGSPDRGSPAAKKTYGDGELQKLTRQYFRANKEQFPESMYPEFLDYYTAIMQNSTRNREADIGKERWRTMDTWDLEKKLTKWHTNNLSDYKNLQQRHESATRPSPNPGTQSGAAGSRPKSGHSKPVKRTPVITPDMLRRDGRSDRNARTDGDRRTIVLDVDRGREPDPAGTDG